MRPACRLGRVLIPCSTCGAERPPVAKKPNYDFEKRKKELDRKAKKDSKREERLRRKREGLPDETDDVEEPVSAESDGSDAP